MKRSSSQPLSTIRDIPDAKLFCARAKAEQIADLLEELPLLLPNRLLYLELTGRTLSISSPEGLEDTPIQCTAHGATTTISRNALRITLSHPRISELEIIYAPREVPTQGTTSLAQAGQPIDLLDEYARLRGQGALNREEQTRLQELPGLIGKEFRERETRLRLARSARSTPEHYGEGRPSFGSRGPG